MKKHKLTLILLLLSLTSAFLYCLAPHFPSWIEQYYSRGINYYWIQALSHLSAILPFSLFELSFFILTLYLLFHIIYRIIRIMQEPTTWKKQITTYGLHALHLICILWLSFSLGWGFNYFRQPLSDSLSLQSSTSPREDLIQLYDYLITQANSMRPYLTEDKNGNMIINDTFNSVKERVQTAYEILGQTHSIFKGSYKLPKGLLISPLMNYTGITGIYSPFTGEANVNTAILDQSLPATALHEMAHQRGFAKEAECNFIAYLACTLHTDKDFQYSGYLLAIAYTSQALAKVDYEMLLALNGTISEAVMRDISHNNAFWKQYEGPVEKASSSVNNSYLKANGIQSGTANYGEMVNLLLSYYVTYLKP